MTAIALIHIFINFYPQEFGIENYETGELSMFLRNSSSRRLLSATLAIACLGLSTIAQAEVASVVDQTDFVEVAQPMANE
jgi:hypothetical protein